MEKMDNRYKEFIIRYKKSEQFKEDIFRTYEEEYQELFENILLQKQEEFLSNLFNHIKLLLIDKYSSRCFEHSELNNLLEKFEKNYQQIYSDDMKIIQNWISTNLQNKKNYIEKGEKFVFLKHCKFQDETPLHHCNKSNNFFIIKIEKVKKAEYRIKILQL